MASASDKSPVALRGNALKNSMPANASSTEPTIPVGENVAEELEQLRDRFRKTTNALASAAHDLKTPLAILNGYVELLQSQKLGPLNERQREVPDL